MNLILFGAGASFGSTLQLPPPLGANLFAELRQFNPSGWGALPPNLANHFQADFERGMSELAKESSHNMPILQRAMAAYFFKFLPTNDSLYVKLAYRIKQSNWTGSVASLNYERLLELSLLHFGLQPVVNAQTLQQNQIELCLPHGCCHLFCEGVQASPTGVSFSGVGVAFDGPVVAISSPIHFNARLNSNSVPPVMSYFESNKTTSSGISFIREQRSRWITLATNAKKIIIIGTKVRQNDSHIWDPIARSSAKVIYCSGPQAALEYTQWASTARSGKENKILTGYFVDKFNEICEEAGIQ